MTSVEIPGLEESSLKSLREISYYKRFERNEAVFREGDKYRGPFMVTEGTFKIFISGDDGKESILNFFGQGKLLACGPMFLSSDTYPASCSAISDGCLVAFKYPELKTVLDHVPELAHYFVCKTIELMQSLKNKIETITLKTAENRILDYFKSLGAEDHAVSLNIPKNQLAALLDLTPESVSRMINQLTKKGLLLTENDLYKIIKN